MRRRTAIGIAVLVAAGVWAGGVAQASPSLLGVTGLVRIPTADVLPEGGYNLAGFVVEANPVDITDPSETTVWMANYGVKGGLELGLLGLSNGSDTLTLNAKLLLEPEVGNRPGIAAGVIDIFDEHELTPFLVFSKTIIPGGGGLPFGSDELSMLRIHIGGASDGVLSGLFAGASFIFAEQFMAMGEWDGDDFNFGGRWFLGHALRAHGFYLGGPEDFGVGLSWNARF